uniref:Uncharacterized protein n=1 Tax=Glossina austeni TaxID=7395 RepID=A0A1A9V4X1_GLOAU
MGEVCNGMTGIAADSYRRNMQEKIVVLQDVDLDLHAITNYNNVKTKLIEDLINTVFIDIYSEYTDTVLEKIVFKTAKTVKWLVHKISKIWQEILPVSYSRYQAMTILQLCPLSFCQPRCQLLVLLLPLRLSVKCVLELKFNELNK